MFRAAAMPSFKEKDKDLLEWYQLQLSKSSTKVHMNTEITDLSSLAADEIVIATGSAGPRSLKIPGAEQASSAVDVLLGNKKVGDNVVIIGGGLTGCELAYELCLQGKHPVIVEMMQDLVAVKGVCMANSNFLRDAMRYYEVPVYLESKTLAIENGAVKVETKEGRTISVPADDVVVSIGYNAGNPFFTEEQKKKKQYPKNVHVIGDADNVANLMKAIYYANNLVLKLSK